jgi:hypothetical protein
VVLAALEHVGVRHDGESAVPDARQTAAPIPSRSTDPA